MTVAKPGTIMWSLQNDDWSDLTVYQIADVLNVRPNSIHSAIHRLRILDVDVKYRRLPRGRKVKIKQ